MQRNLPETCQRPFGSGRSEEGLDSPSGGKGGLTSPPVQNRRLIPCPRVGPVRLEKPQPIVTPIRGGGQIAWAAVLQLFLLLLLGVHWKTASHSEQRKEAFTLSGMSKWQHFISGPGGGKKVTLCVNPPNMKPPQILSPPPPSVTKLPKYIKSEVYFFGRAALQAPLPAESLADGQS